MLLERAVSISSQKPVKPIGQGLCTVPIRPKSLLRSARASEGSSLACQTLARHGRLCAPRKGRPHCTETGCGHLIQAQAAAGQLGVKGRCGPLGWPRQLGIARSFRLPLQLPPQLPPLPLGLGHPREDGHVHLRAICHHLVSRQIGRPMQH